MIKTMLWAMIKEEWRIHTKTARNQLFKFFPLVIGVASLLCSLFIPYMLNILQIKELFLYTHYMFLFFGLSVGGFGLFGKEIMNRRFGQISLIAYSSRSLPVSEQKVFLSFFIKDVLFYLFLWIFPIFIGFCVVAPFIGFSLSTAFVACATLFLSFLLGLVLVFFLSTIYAHSIKILGILFAILFGIMISLYIFYSFTFKQFILPYQLFYQRSWITFGGVLAFIILASILSIVFVKIDYPERKKHHTNLLTPWTKRFGFSTHSYFIAKDFLDLKRSEGGLGKIIFSFLLPILFTYLFLSIFVELIPTVKTIMIFAIFLGIVSSTIYNMITEFDSFNPYLFLPVKVSTILKSKIMSFLLINLFSLLILTIAAITMQQLFYFIPAVFLFISIAIFTLAVTIYLTGLHPNLLLYNPKQFISYVSLLSPPLFLFTILAILQPFSMLGSIILLPVSWMFLTKSFKKWDQWTPVNL